MSAHPTLTPDFAARLADLALGHVTREYPNKLDHVLGGAEDARGPRELHPVFYGSFDWHSCVHSYWLLARLYGRFPDLANADAIKARLDDAFTSDKIAGELAYLQRLQSAGFERPYGWAWLLKLAAELAGQDTDEGRRWSGALAPLAQAFAARFMDFLPKADYPVRAGAHTNTAFALTLALDYAQACHDEGLATLIGAKLRAWYGADVDAQAWEPSGDDFLSPTLVEAQAMRRTLAPAAFEMWIDRFLPRLSRGEPRTLFAPAVVSDRSDGKIAHLDGLNLSRAWCWRSLAPALDGKARAAALAAAERHLEASLPHVAGDYMGEHWLATYALLALEA
jgi:hypothetical protein